MKTIPTLFNCLIAIFESYYKMVFYVIHVKLIFCIIEYIRIYFMFIYILRTRYLIEFFHNEPN